MYSTKRHEYPRMLITMIIVLLWPSGLIKQLINKSNKMLPFTWAVSFWVKIWLINYMGGLKSQVMKLMLSIINCDKPFWHRNYISYFLLRGDNMATGWPVTAQWHYNEIIIPIHWYIYCTASEQKNVFLHTNRQLSYGAHACRLQQNILSAKVSYC